jgi:uncharacterized protein (TIGR01777 family)
MKILIAGATGFVGKELVRQCHEAKISVHYLTTGKPKILQQEHYRGFYWNPKKNEIDSAAFDGVTAIVNLAGATVAKRWTPTYKKIILESRIKGTQILFDTLQKIEHEVTQYISASGISIYPTSTHQLYTEEDLQVSDSFLGKVTAEWEAEANQFQTLNIKVAKLRTGIVLGNEEGALPKIAKPIKMGVGALLGRGDQWQSWIHIKDIAGIYLLLLTNQCSGVFNGVGPSPVTHKKMIQIIADYLHKRLWLPKIPGFMIKLLLGEMGTLVLESQLVSAQKIIEAGYHFHYVNLEKAIEDLL